MKSTEQQKFSDNCALLIALLEDHRREVTGLDDVPYEEKLFGLASSASEVLLHTIAIMSAADYSHAVEGLRRLSLERRLRQICNIMEQQLKDRGYD
jgi:hypothetical protein